MPREEYSEDEHEEDCPAALQTPHGFDLSRGWSEWSRTKYFGTKRARVENVEVFRKAFPSRKLILETRA